MPSSPRAPLGGLVPSGGRRPGLAVVLAVAVGALPLLVAVVALSRTTWYPVGDLAQAALRQESFWGHPPLVGAAGRIATTPTCDPGPLCFGQQGNHPGPAMFWASWPLWWVLGGSGWAYQASVAALAVAAFAATVYVAYRHRGPRLAFAVAVVGAVLLRAFGASALTQPWNPYTPLVPYLLFVVLCWAAVSGRAKALPAAVAAGAYCVQCHVGYAPAVGAGLAVAVAGAVLEARRAAVPGAVRRLVAWTGAAVLVGVVLWIPPIIDQLVHDPGNVSILLDTFRDQTDEVIGFRRGAHIWLTQLDPLGNWLLGTRRIQGSASGGAALLVAWAAAATVAWRARHRDLNRLNLVLAVQSACALYWALRLDSDRYLYLVEWFWVLTGLIVLSVGWTAAIVARHRRPAWRVDRRGPALAAVALLASTAAFTYSAARVDPPDQRYSETVGALVGPTTAALEPGRTYLVNWVDPDALGGNGFGLFLQLDRAGYDVRATSGFSAAVEPHRVGDAAHADAVITVVSGDDNIAAARALPGVEELARTDHRPPAQRARYRELQARAQAQLRAIGRDDLADSVPTSIWVALIDPATPDDAFDTLSAMLAIGQGTAVFRSAEPLVL
ncbi:MAG: hypothetical protein KF703_16665 [Actinobacteria bacterium]|nr:hypothetical protein [Actinomycetota bacterium]